jgi:hypothetical protein
MQKTHTQNSNVQISFAACMHDEDSAVANTLNILVQTMCNNSFTLQEVNVTSVAQANIVLDKYTQITLYVSSTVDLCNVCYALCVAAVDSIKLRTVN